MGLSVVNVDSDSMFDAVVDDSEGRAGGTVCILTALSFSRSLFIFFMVISFGFENL